MNTNKWKKKNHLNIRPKTKILLHENTGQDFITLHLAIISWNRTQKATKEKNRQMDFTKISKFCTSKDNMKRV